MKIIKKFHSIESFETERLLAIRMQQHDLDKLIRMNTDPRVMQTLGGIQSRQRIQEGLTKNLQHWDKNGFGPWMFYLKDTHAWIGRGGLRHVDVGGNEEIEVGYALLPAFWRQGFATEIAAASCEIAFEVLRLKNIVCFALTTNLASQQVMQKVGFQYECDCIYYDLPHALYRLQNYRKAILVPFNKNWSEYFKQEAEQIKTLLKDECAEIHHIGSTAIPGMPAKPVIDILLVSNDINEIETIKKKLCKLGYNYLHRSIIPHRSFFSAKENGGMRFHLHVYERGDPQINRHINFRDFIIHHPEQAKRYAGLKLTLSEKFRDDMYNYVLGKDKLVQEIDAQAKQWVGRRKEFLSSFTGLPTKNWSQEKIIQAMEANLNLYMTYYAQYLNQVELIRVPGFTLVNTGLPDDSFNYVLDANFTEQQAEQKITEVTHYFKQKNVPFSWWLSPNDKPTQLADILISKNYQHAENNTAMYFDLDTWDGNSIFIPELEIVRANDKKTFQDLALILVNDASAFKIYFDWIAEIYFDDDPIEYYVGYVKGKPVVRGLSCYYANVVGLYMLSTLPNEQSKDYAKAMQYFRLNCAKKRGYHIGVLQASAQSYTLYQKFGYKECGMFKEFKL